VHSDFLFWAHNICGAILNYLFSHVLHQDWFHKRILLPLHPDLNCHNTHESFHFSQIQRKPKCAFSSDVILGVARGCGWQKIGACINLGAYYIAGIPSAYLIAFVLRVGGMVSLVFFSQMCYRF
jgi:hypothetical protein